MMPDMVIVASKGGIRLETISSGYPNSVMIDKVHKIEMIITSSGKTIAFNDLTTSRSEITMTAKQMTRYFFKFFSISLIYTLSARMRAVKCAWSKCSES